MKEYLENRFYSDNSPKYRKYFNMWYAGITMDQLHYFNIDRIRGL
jgi:hypothetical protein